MQALGLVETRGLVGAVEGADAMLKAADVRLLEKSLAGGGLVTITVTGSVSAVQASVDAACAAIERIPGTSLVSSHVIPRPDDQIHAILKLDPDPEPTPGTTGGTTPERETPKDLPRDLPRDPSQDPTRDAPKDKPKATPEAAPEATLEAGPKASPKAAPKAAVAEVVTKSGAAKSGAAKPVVAHRSQPRGEKPAAASKASAGSEPATGASRTTWTEEELKAMSLGNLRALARRENIDLNGKGLAKGLAQASKRALIQALLKAGERDRS